MAWEEREGGRRGLTWRLPILPHGTLWPQGTALAREPGPRESFWEMWLGYCWKVTQQRGVLLSPVAGGGPERTQTHPFPGPDTSTHASADSSSLVQRIVMGQWGARPDEPEALGPALKSFHFAPVW